jgi:hypothetical protein
MNNANADLVITIIPPGDQYDDIIFDGIGD